MLESRRFQGAPRFAYLPESDRYVTRRPEPRYRINQIGCGTNGLEHIRVAEFEGRAVVHGIYDPNPGSVQAAHEIMARTNPEKNLVVYPDLLSACTDPQVDALIISTPNYTHLDVVETALAGGKHILLEKPMATTVPDARRILEASRNYGAVFQIGLQYRFKSIYREALKEALGNGAVGDVRQISLREHRIPFLDKVGQWNKFSEFSGGTLVEKCCHYFDLMNLFAQSRPVRVFASGGQAVSFRDFEYEGRRSDIMDHAYAIVEYGNGVRAGLDLNMFAPLFHEEMVICGSEGWLRVAEQQDFLSVEGIRCSLELYRGERHPSVVGIPQYPKHVEASGHHGATFLEHVHFVDNIEGRKTETATVEEGYWSIVVGCAAELSVVRGVPVEIAELTQS